MIVSIVMATYNGENHIIHQLNSLLNQTRRADEVLIYDDGSTDNTVEMINRYLAENKLDNWKLIINKVNKGWRKNFFEGICAAKGDMIFPCDQDDIWFEDKISVMEKIMAKHDNISLLVSNYRIENDKGYKVCPNENNGNLIKIKQYENIFSTPYPGCTFCIRKDLVNKVKDYWGESFPHDAFFWRFAMINESLFCINRDLIIWKIHNDSSFSLEKSSKKSIKKKLEWINYAYEVVTVLNQYIYENNDSSQKKYIDIVEKNKQWLDLRKEFFITKKISLWIALYKYIGIYPMKKQYLYDLYYVLKNKF